MEYNVKCSFLKQTDHHSKTVPLQNQKEYASQSCVQLWDAIFYINIQSFHFLHFPYHNICSVSSGLVSHTDRSMEHNYLFLLLHHVLSLLARHFPIEFAWTTQFTTDK